MTTNTRQFGHAFLVRLIELGILQLIPAQILKIHRRTTLMHEAFEVFACFHPGLVNIPLFLKPRKPRLQLRAPRFLRRHRAGASGRSRGNCQITIYIAC